MSERVGLTYDLREEYLRLGWSAEEASEFDSDETVIALQETLTALGYRVERVGHVRNLVEALASGQRWDLVFNIAEGVHGAAREAQVPALLDAYGIPYTFSDPLVLGLTLHKGLTKRVVRDLGLPTPEFAVLERPADVDGVQVPFPLFVKPVAEGSSKGVHDRSRVESPGELQAVACELLRRFPQGVLVESFLPGREVTVGMVDTGPSARVLGVMESCMEEEAAVYSYAAKVDFRRRVRYRIVTGALAEEAARIARAVWTGLGCRDAGRVDLRCDRSGRPQFLEVNPLPGLQPGYSDLCILCELQGIPHAELIRSIVESARERRQAPTQPAPAGAGSFGGAAS